MKRALLPLLVLVQSLAVSAFAEVKAPAWPQEQSDIPPDSRLHFGTLANGMRYVVMKHAEPPGRASIRLYVHAGSLQETEEQRGLAHFLEHMAFNGTRNFKGTEIIEFLQRLGSAFGSDINAHTSFDETVYKLDLPDVKPETIDQGMTIMRDWADGMLLDSEEIEKERGVIMKEKLGRDSIRFRMMEAEIDFLFPEHLLSKRMPIGTEEVIKTAPRDRFVEFYHHYYQPNRMVMVIVGDIDPEAMAATVRKTFESMKAQGPAGAEPNMGNVTAESLRAKVHPEAEASGTQVSLTTLESYVRKPDTEANRIAEFPLRLANAIINRRLSILAKKADAPFATGGAFAADFYQAAEMANVELRCQPEQWAGALATAEKEIRRAVLHGFTQAELKEAKAELLNAYERAVETAATDKAPDIANGIVASFGANEVFSSPQDDLRIATKALENITPEECQASFKKRWETDAVQIMLAGNLIETPTEDQVSQVFLTSRQEPVSPPEERAEEAFAYQDFGAPGQVVSRKEIEDLGITQIVFKNGVRVNLKPTDFEKDTIRISASFGGGKLTQPKDKPGIDLLAQSAFEAAGLEKHSADDLQRLFAGKNVGVSFSVDDDRFALSGRTTPEDLADQLRLLCAHFIAAGYREEALLRLRKMLPMIAKQVESTPNGVMSAKVARFIHGDDPRFGIPAQEALEKLTLSDMKSWLEPQLERAPMEVSLVGSIEPDQVIPLLQNTFGALPDRDAKRPNYDNARKIQFPKDVKEKVFPYESKLGKSLTLVYWPTTDRRGDIGMVRRFSILADILADRLRNQIREELGEAYSPRAYNQSSDAFPEYGYTFAMSPGAADKASLVAQRIVEIGANLAANGTNADELERSLKPLLTTLKEQRRNNGYWLGSVLGRCQEEPQRLDWARSMEKDFESVTVEEINALAKKYLTSDHAVKVIITTEDQSNS